MTLNYGIVQRNNVEFCNLANVDRNQSFNSPTREIFTLKFKDPTTEW